MTKISPPIVYLDQCHWITLAQAQFARNKVPSSDELTAADIILKAARSGRIRLPLSGAHAVETAKAGNGMRRHQLADTMLSVYSGWHMNSPIIVRGEELARALAQQDASLDRDQVFNQHPGTPFGVDMPYVCSDQTLPLQVQRFVEDQSWRLAWADTLRSDTYEELEWTAASEAIQGWARTHQDLSTYLMEHPTNRNLRVVAASQTFADLEQEIAATIVRVRLSDNAMIESFWATLKKECPGETIFSTRNEAKTAIFEYIEIYYNRKRKHSSLAYLSPVQYEKQGEQRRSDDT